MGHLLKAQRVLSASANRSLFCALCVFARKNRSQIVRTHNLLEKIAAEAIILFLKLQWRSVPYGYVYAILNHDFLFGNLVLRKIGCRQL